MTGNMVQINLLEYANPAAVTACHTKSGWRYLGNKGVPKIRWYQNNLILEGFPDFQELIE